MPSWLTGLDIQNDLKKLGLQLNIPPFLKDKVGFEEDGVIKTQTLKPYVIKTAYMWRELFARLEGSEYFIQSFQFLCWDV